MNICIKKNQSKLHESFGEGNVLKNSYAHPTQLSLDAVIFNCSTHAECLRGDPLFFDVSDVLLLTLSSSIAFSSTFSKDSSGTV